MSHVAVIVGISGRERFLARDARLHPETTERKRAKGFRSDSAAKRAAEGYLERYQPCVRKHMAFRVEPA